MNPIYEYYIKPILTNEGYNPVNTATYAIVFLLAIYLAKKVFSWLSISIDREWFRATVKIALVGGLIRAMDDWILANYGYNTTHFILATPGIYILLASIIVLTAVIDRKSYKDRISRINNGLIILLTIILVVMLITTGLYNLQYILGALLASLGIGFLVWKFMKVKGLAENEDKWLILGHSLDGITTFVALSMIPGYFEEHVVTNFLVSLFGPSSYPIVKLILAMTAVYLINTSLSESDKDEREWKWLIKLFLVIIGLGPGTRDLVRIALGV